MSSEEEKRLHRCCFTGQRPEKLDAPEAEVKRWLEEQIDRAIGDGFVTFISGCGMGADIWAGQIVLEKREKHPGVHLIAASPWPGFARRWNEEWQALYDDLIRRADLNVCVSDHYHDGVFLMRNVWMVEHSARVIAYYNGAPGGTQDTIDHAAEKGIEVICNLPLRRETSDDATREGGAGPVGTQERHPRDLSREKEEHP